MKKKNSAPSIIFVLVLIVSFPTLVFADWSYGDVDLTVDLSAINYKNCSTAYASGDSDSTSDVQSYDGPAVCDPWVNATVLGAYGMGANFFPRDSFFGEYGTDADVTAFDGAAIASVKTDTYSGIIAEDYQLDFQIDYEHDVFGDDSWVIFYISLWSEMTAEGDVLPEHVLLEEKDGWTYSDVGSIFGDEFWVLAKSYTYDSFAFETTIWADIDILAGNSYNVYAGVTSMVNIDNYSPIPAGTTAIPEPATLLLISLGGLVLRRKR